MSSPRRGVKARGRKVIFDSLRGPDADTALDFAIVDIDKELLRLQVSGTRTTWRFGKCRRPALALSFARLIAQMVDSAKFFDAFLTARRYTRAVRSFLPNIDRLDR